MTVAMMSIIRTVGDELVVISVRTMAGMITIIGIAIVGDREKEEEKEGVPHFEGGD